MFFARAKLSPGLFGSSAVNFRLRNSQWLGKVIAATQSIYLSGKSSHFQIIYPVRTPIVIIMHSLFSVKTGPRLNQNLRYSRNDIQ